MWTVLKGSLWPVISRVLSWCVCLWGWLVRLFIFSALDACQLNPCPDPYAMCRISESGERECSCPQICTADVSPVCGTDGQTYNNECQMKVSACSQGMMIKVKSRGRCKSKHFYSYKEMSIVLAQLYSHIPKQKPIVVFCAEGIEPKVSWRIKRVAFFSSNNE